MRKSALFLLLGTALLQLAGCGAAESYLAERIQEEFEVSAGENYQDYQEYQGMKEANLLNGEGMYREAGDKDQKEEEVPSGTIHVTFAENSFLKAEYYFDEELTRRVDTENCHINPGDSIYMSVNDGGGECPDGYTFAGFRVWEWQADGSRRVWLDVGGELPVVMTVPGDSQATQLSVAPLGEYRKKILSFSDSYRIRGGEEIELSGVWRTDNGVETTDTSAEISPFTSYIVSYDYGAYKDRFYFEKSTPEPFYVSEEKGTVQFDEESQSYSVWLHPYIRVRIINNEANIFNSAISAVTGSGGIVRAISVNGKSQAVSGKKEQFIEKLKWGDKIQIQVGDGYKATAGGLEADTPGAEVKDGYEYVFTVPQTLETELEIVIDRDRD